MSDTLVRMDIAEVSRYSSALRKPAARSGLLVGGASMRLSDTRRGRTEISISQWMQMMSHPLLQC